MALPFITLAFPFKVIPFPFLTGAFAITAAFFSFRRTCLGVSSENKKECFVKIQNVFGYSVFRVAVIDSKSLSLYSSVLNLREVLKINGCNLGLPQKLRGGSV